MAFQVELTTRAARDIDDIFRYVETDAPMNAARWRQGLEQTLQRLTFMARNFPLAAENEQAPCEVRQMLFGKYRILYTVQDTTAFVLTIRHGARLPMTAAELWRLWKS